MLEAPRLVTRSLTPMPKAHQQPQQPLADQTVNSSDPKRSGMRSSLVSQTDDLLGVSCVSGCGMWTYGVLAGGMGAF